MLTVIMLIMVMAALSVLMLGVVVAQVKPTMFADKNARTVFAAETGLDAALSQMRSALGAPDIVTARSTATRRKLPCTVQGAVDRAPRTPLTYKVDVTYFDQNPTGKDATWRAANKLHLLARPPVCRSRPSFAILLSSQGVDAGIAGLAARRGDRTIETIYTFQVTQQQHRRRHDLRLRRQALPAGDRPDHRLEGHLRRRRPVPRRRPAPAVDLRHGLRHPPVRLRPGRDAPVHHRQLQHRRQHRRHADQVHADNTDPDVQLAGWRAVERREQRQARTTPTSA